MPADNDVAWSNTTPPSTTPKKRWSTPTVIKSDIEETDKLADLIEVELLPTGPS